MWVQEILNIHRDANSVDQDILLYRDDYMRISVQCQCMNSTSTYHLHLYHKYTHGNLNWIKED